MRLVQDQVLPLLTPEDRLVLGDQPVRGDAHVERVGLGPALALQFTLLGGAKVGQDLKRRGPLLELNLPVQHHGRGYHDEVRAPYAVVARQVRQQRDGLDRLPEAHLVGEDPVESLVVAAHQPVESHVLVLAQRVLQQERDPALDVRGLQRVSLGLQRAGITRERVENAPALARGGFLFLRHRGFVVAAECVHAGLVLIFLVLVDILLIFLIFLIFVGLFFFLRRVAAAVRSLHLPVPPHELLDGNLGIRREIVHLLLVVVVVTLGLGPSHLLLQGLLVVVLVLTLGDLELVVIVEVFGGRGGGRLALYGGGSGSGSGRIDDVRERALPGLLTGRARGVHRGRFLCLCLDDRLFGSHRLSLLHLAVPAEEFLDGHLGVGG